MTASDTGGGRGGWSSAAALAGLVAVAAVLTVPLVHGWLLGGDEAALSRDFGSIFLDTVIQQHRALLDGALLLWDPSQLGGTPAWSLPNTAVAYPPLLLSIALLGPLTGLKACLLAHLVLGMAGVVAATRVFGGSRVAALIAAVLFASAPFTQHLLYVLPLEVFGLAWFPWAMAALGRARTEPRWLGYAVAAGVAYAALPWAGAYILVLRGFILFGFLVLLFGRDAGTARGTGRTALVLLVFLATFVAVAFGRLWPTMSWIPDTDRIEPTLAYAMDGVVPLGELWEWLRREGVVPLVLCACALVCGRVRRGDGRLPLLAALAVVLLLATGPLHRFLFEFVPGYAFIREPRRAWLLMPVVVPLLAGLGWTCLAARLPARRGLRLLAGVLCVGLVVGELAIAPRYTAPRLDSLSARLSANAIHQDLRARAATEPRFRVLDIEKARTKAKRTADLLRTALGLESLEGLVGNVSYERFDEWLIESRFARARLLGVLNTKYVLSTEELDEPGLEFVSKFPRDPRRMVPGHDGPFLYRNEEALPRAFLADHALLDVGAPDELRRATLLRAAWDPRSSVLLQVEEEELAPLDVARLPPVSAAVVASDEVEEELREGGVAAVLRADAPGGTARWIRTIRSQRGRPVTPLPDPQPRWNTLSLELPEDAGGRWLVLAETFALHRGWSATVDGEPAPLLRANVVATALPVPPGAREVRLRYTPPGFRVGVATTLLSLALILVLFGWVLPRRRAQRDLGGARSSGAGGA